MQKNIVPKKAPGEKFLAELNAFFLSRFFSSEVFDEYLGAKKSLLNDFELPSKEILSISLPMREENSSRLSIPEDEGLPSIQSSKKYFQLVPSFPSAKKKEFKCTVENCGKIYKSKENLTLHVKNVHQKVKPYRCRFCQTGFSHRNGKTYHERKFHINYLPYKCTYDICGYSFAAKSALCAHIKSVHLKIKKKVNKKTNEITEEQNQKEIE